MAILQLQAKDKQGVLKNTGKIEIKNQSEEKAELYFYGDIVSNTWQSYWYEEDKCPQDISDFLNEIENTKEVDIYINSGGGSVHGGLAIYNLLKRHNGFKTVHVDGIAASIASIIALAGDKVIIPKNAQFMIHKPSCSLWGSYNADEFRSMADSLDVCQESILNIYLDHAKEGVTAEKLTELINKETWFTGESAEEYFNIEVEDSAEMVACNSDYFEKYNNVPEALKNKDNIIDINSIIDTVVNKITEKNNKKEAEALAALEAEKESLLEDLDLFGI